MNKEDLRIRIEEALDEIRPHLAVDGGNVELVSIEEDLTIKLKWLGNCENCNMSAMTLRAGIQETIRNRVPQVKSVVAINGIPA